MKNKNKKVKAFEDFWKLPKNWKVLSFLQVKNSEIVFAYHPKRQSEISAFIFDKDNSEYARWIVNIPIL